MEMLLIAAVLLLFLAMPMLQIRKQNKELQKVRQMQTELQNNDHVQTSSGVHGIVSDVAEHTVDLEVAPGVIMTWEKMAIIKNVTAEERANASAAAPEEPAAQQADSVKDEPANDAHPYQDESDK